MKIFDADELIIISRWILSLQPSAVNDIFSLVLQRRKLAEKIENHVTLKLADKSHKSLKQLFAGNITDLLAAFRASEWTVPFVSHFDYEVIREVKMIFKFFRMDKD